MEVKTDVQKRRQDRIRELKTRTGEPGRERIGDVAAPTAASRLGLEREHPLEVRGPAFDHGGDPELAWKERQKELLRRYSRSDAAAEGTVGGQGSGEEGGRFGGRGPFRRMFLTKTVIAVLVFAAVWAVYRLDQPWTREYKRYIASALTEDMDFETVAAWYDRTFSGAPSFLPAFGVKGEAAKVQATVAPNRFVQPVKGKVVEAFTIQKQGIWVETRTDALAAAMDEGRIEFAGEQEGTGHTLIIQHTDGYRTVYGGLMPTKWEAGDWVKAGDVIGTVWSDANGKSRMFLSVMKDQRYINPVEVAAFD